MCNNVKQSCGAMNLWSHSTTAFSTLLAAPLLTSTLINFYHLVFAIKMLKSVEERGLPYCPSQHLHFNSAYCPAWIMMELVVQRKVTKVGHRSSQDNYWWRSVKSPDKIFIQDPTSGSPDYSHREVLIKNCHQQQPPGIWIVIGWKVFERHYTAGWSAENTHPTDLKHQF